MSKKYLVLANIDGKVRILSLRSNDTRRGIERTCRQMLRKLFQGNRIGRLSVRPWPVDGLV